MTVDFSVLREKMVSIQLSGRGINDTKLLEAFKNIPRHIFVSEDVRRNSYDDHPLSIGQGQTISQPYMTALMTELLEIKADDKVLEVGTGSGYQAAVLFYLGAEVYSIEINDFLAAKAEEILDSLSYKVRIKKGDGSLGWTDYSPYDKVIITAASPELSPCWKEQLKIGGRLVVPLGKIFHQELTVIDKVAENEFRQKKICECVFVPLLGKYGFKNI